VVGVQEERARAARLRLDLEHAKAQLGQDRDAFEQQKVMGSVCSGMAIDSTSPAELVLAWPAAALSVCASPAGQQRSFQQPRPSKRSCTRAVSCLTQFGANPHYHGTLSIRTSRHSCTVNSLSLPPHPPVLQREEAARFEAQRLEELRRLQRDRRVLEKQSRAVLKMPTKQSKEEVAAVEVGKLVSCFVDVSNRSIHPGCAQPWHEDCRMLSCVRDGLPHCLLFSASALAASNSTSAPEPAAGAAGGRAADWKGP
jgi:hypothetical protein